MTFKTYITLLLIILCLKTGAQTFQATYGGSSGDDAADICLTADGGYVMAGSTTSFGAGGTDVYLIKINSIGGVLWSKTFGGLGNEDAKSIEKTNDGGYIIAGTTSSFGMGNKDCYLIKTDVNGVLQWSKTYGNLLNESVSKLILTTDGGYMLTGSCDDNDSIGDKNFFLLKTDSLGIVQWSSIYNSFDMDEAFDIKQTTDHGYVLTGSNYDIFPSPYNKILLLKTDSIGNIQWSRTYGNTTSMHYGTSIEETNDGGYVVLAGRPFTISLGGSSYVIKTDSVGTIEWQKHYSKIDGGRLKKTSTGGYMIGGYFHDGIYTGPWTTPYFYLHAILVKLDTAGVVEWSHKYHGIENPTIGRSFRETTDNGYVLVGSMDSVPVASDVYLVKADAWGNSGCAQTDNFCSGVLGTALPEIIKTYINFPSSFSELSATTISGSGGLSLVNMLCYVGIEENISQPEEVYIYPNPTIGQFNFSNIDNNSTIRIYDCMGKLVLQTILKNSEQTIDISNQEKGIYFYRIENQKGEFSSGKIILQ